MIPFTVFLPETILKSELSFHFFDSPRIVNFSIFPSLASYNRTHNALKALPEIPFVLVFFNNSDVFMVKF